MNPAKHLAICAEIQQLHQVRIAQLEAKQRTWVGLTHAELVEIHNAKSWDTIETWDYEQAIEAKLKEKNT